MEATLLQIKISNGDYDRIFKNLYSDSRVASARARYVKAIEEYISLYDNDDIEILSVPGRCEILGNHTDHNNGCVLASAINLDIIAVVSKKTGNNNKVRIKSEGFIADEIDMSDLKAREEEKYTSAALIRGISARFKELGYETGAFNAYTTSDILKGSGLSSSAAFEVMIAFIYSHLFNGDTIPFEKLAQIGQYAENIYFDKPCGLMDQTACASGGFVFIDFKNKENPAVSKLDFDLSTEGYSLCIVAPGGSHADLNDEYAAITNEMKNAAAYFNKPVLRDVNKEEFFGKIKDIKRLCGDRAVLRAIHFFNENERVLCGVDALKNDDLQLFLKKVEESGNSSFKYLQNVYVPKNPVSQNQSLALAVSEDILRGIGGAVRIHGGGFAGTILVFLPKEHSMKYKHSVERVFGANTCIELNVRKQGAVTVI